MSLAPQLAHECRDAKIINILARIATDIPTPYKTRIAAAVVYRGTVVALGVNQKKTHPFQAKYSKHPESVYLHAETAAIKNSLKFLSAEELSEATLYVCRVKYFDKNKRRMVFGLAQPCPGCLKCIQRFGIGNVVYTIDGSGFEQLAAA